MTDPNHGNSIITHLRLICEEMYNERHNMSAAAGLRSQAENILPIASVDDIEVIVLREAASILNGRDWADLADKVEGAAQMFSAEQLLNGNKTALAPFARNTVPFPPPPPPRVAPWVPAMPMSDTTRAYIEGVDDQRAAADIANESGVGVAACLQIIGMVGIRSARRVVAAARLAGLDPVVFAKHAAR